MEQATATTTPAPPGTDTFTHAHAVAGGVVAELRADQRPFALEIEEDFPSGHRVHLKFRETRARGLLAFASFVDVPVTRADTAFGVHLDAITRIKDVEVRASALVSPAQAAELEGEPAPLPDVPEAQPVQPVPLGFSVVAEAPVITAVHPLNTGDLGAEDVARCVRCGCTEERACEGGCYWVPNRQMVDFCSACATPTELQAMTYTAEVSDGGE